MIEEESEGIFIRFQEDSEADIKQTPSRNDERRKFEIRNIVRHKQVGESDRKLAPHRTHSQIDRPLPNLQIHIKFDTSKHILLDNKQHTSSQQDHQIDNTNNQRSNRQTSLITFGKCLRVEPVGDNKTVYAKPHKRQLDQHEYFHMLRECQTVFDLSDDEADHQTDSW